MASKENQKALKDIIECHGCNGNYCECGNFEGCENCLAPYTLRKAIDDLELYKKALQIINTNLGKGYKDEYYLEQARKELENGK